jgi:hypothetical protein
MKMVYRHVDGYDHHRSILVMEVFWVCRGSWRTEGQRWLEVEEELMA